MGHTILVVGTDRRFVDWLSDHLIDEGFQVRHAFTGRMALDALDRVPTDLVVAEAILPDMDADTLAWHLAARQRPVHLVALGEGILWGDGEGVHVRASDRDQIDRMVRQMIRPQPDGDFVTIGPSEVVDRAGLAGA